MTDDSTIPNPPDDLPADLREVLADHANDVHGLQETIIYARELLNDLQESELPIEPAEGEEIVRVKERLGYIEVVKRYREMSDAYLYHVQLEPRPDGEERLHWSLIGRVEEDEI